MARVVVGGPATVPYLGEIAAFEAREHLLGGVAKLHA